MISINIFKEKSIKEYGEELCLSREMSKNKIQSETKKYIRKLSRKRLKNELLKARVD